MTTSDDILAKLEAIASRDRLPTDTPHIEQGRVQKINAMIEIAGRIRTLDPTLVVADWRGHLNQQVSVVIRAFQLLDTCLSKPPAQADLESLNSTLDRAYEICWQQFAVPIALASQPIGVSNYLADLVKEIEQFRDRSEEVLAEIQTAATKTAVAVHAQVFSEEADRHWRWKIPWLIGILIFAGAILSFGWLLFARYTGEASPTVGPQTIQAAIASIAIISALYFLLVWCARSFRAHSHNETINRHRANALKTFAAFAEGATSDQIRDAVLVHASQCIFSPQITGFASGQESDSNATPQIFEIFRGAGQVAR